MKRYIILVLGLLFASAPSAFTQVVFSSGPASGTTQLVPFGSTCFAASPTNTSVCGFTATFQFTSTQCCACPTSGMICLPGSVAYGGPGSSSSFTNYHTLSYSPSNEHQRISFSQKITKFQWRASGPAGAAEPFQIQVFDGATLLGTYNFTVPGTGLNNTYNITAPQFDRLDFTEIVAISADDELFGDFRVATAGCPLGLAKLECDITVLGPNMTKVNWHTEEETDIVNHVVLRSSDSQVWTEIGDQPARNTIGPNDYSFVDQAAPFGINYYRVKSIAIDGTETYSNIVTAQFVEKGGINVVLYPNPTSGNLNVDFAGLDGAKELTIMNQLGQVLGRYTADGMSIDLPVSDLANGVYLLVVTNDQGSTARRFEVRK